jgi:iron complex transport system permease protein
MALQMETRRSDFVPVPRKSRTMLKSGVAGNLGLVLLGLLSIAMLLASVMTGASAASMTRVLQALLFPPEGDAAAMLARDRIVIIDIRLPRAGEEAKHGAALAVSGAVMQGLFRNPLADPGVVGVSSGASLGAVFYIIFGHTLLAPVTVMLGMFALPSAAFLGGLAVTLVLYVLASRDGETQIGTLLIAGIAVAALAMALTGLLIYMADDRQLRDITFWSLGSLAGSTWEKAGIAALVILPAMAIVPFLSRGLNAFTLGEAAAFHMGVPVETFKRAAIVVVAAATGVSVAFSGGIVFVGIIVPHLIRLATGPDHRFLLPASALLGGSLLLVADMVTRTIVAPAELPIGILTALIGAPFFLWILFRGRSGRIM